MSHGMSCHVNCYILQLPAYQRRIWDCKKPEYEDSKFLQNVSNYSSNENVMFQKSWIFSTTMRTSILKNDQSSQMIYCLPNLCLLFIYIYKNPRKQQVVRGPANYMVIWVVGHWANWIKLLPQWTIPRTFKFAPYNCKKCDKLNLL